MVKSPVSYVGYLLALIGGIILIVFSLLALLGFIFALPFRSPLESLNIFGHELVSLVLGVIAVIASKRVDKLLWAIILIIIGYFGGGFGGLLIIIGGILGLVSVLIKKT